MQPFDRARVMCIGRSDCIGGAGIQSDIKAVMAMGAFGTSVITTVNADDTNTNFDIVEMPPTIIVRQIERIVREVGVDGIKIGRLLSEEQIDIIANILERDVNPVPMVIAPILMSPTGAPRLSVRAIAALKRRLLHVATLLCVSREEAEVLTGMEINDPEEMTHAATMLVTLGCQAVLINGGAFGREKFVDILATADDVITYTDMPGSVIATYGVKTVLAAAIATGLSQGMDITEAVVRGRNFVLRAAENGITFVEGPPIQGPIATADA